MSSPFEVSSGIVVRQYFHSFPFVIPLFMRKHFVIKMSAEGLSRC